MPQSSADAFKLLQQSGKLDTALATRLSGMAGFRNIAIHQYQDIDPQVIHFMMQTEWRDWIMFCEALNLRIEP